MPHNLTRTRGRPTRPSRLANPPAHHRGHGPVRGGRDAREAMNFATARRTAGRNRRLRGERRSPSSDTRRGTASSPPVMAGGKGCRAVAMNYTAAAPARGYSLSTRCRALTIGHQPSPCFVTAHPPLLPPAKGLLADWPRQKAAGGRSSEVSLSQSVRWVSRGQL